MDSMSGMTGRVPGSPYTRYHGDWDGERTEGRYSVFASGSVTYLMTRCLKNQV